MTNVINTNDMYACNITFEPVMYSSVIHVFKALKLSVAKNHPDESCSVFYTTHKTHESPSEMLAAYMLEAGIDMGLISSDRAI